MRRGPNFGGKATDSRHTEVRSLARCLHKELEWIPLKAMRKERAERYRSAAELADDIENYLQGNPLIAGPPGALYRVRKFTRRHQTSVVATAAVFLMAVVGAIVSLVFAIGQARALDRQARALAENEAMVSFLRTDILDPFAAERFKPTNAREVFDAAAAKLDSQFVDYPLLEASMRFAFGNAYAFQFADYDMALLHLERALEIQRRELDGNPHTTMNWLGLVYYLMGRYPEAEATFRGLLGSLDELHERGVGRQEDLYYAAKAHLGTVIQTLGRFDEAEPYMWGAVLHPWWTPGHWRRSRVYASIKAATTRPGKSMRVSCGQLKTFKPAAVGTSEHSLAYWIRSREISAKLGSSSKRRWRALRRTWERSM
jgi:tetratricopeptide (TPR) repeat protein